jgi:hypothetical protein
MIINSGRRNKYTGHIPVIDHEELVKRAFTYLKFSVGCTVVFKERVASGSENPDVIGFKGGFSYLIECKSSRADFLADKKKHFRKNPDQGMGAERYFMSPVGLLEPSEIPERWGLLEVYEVPPMCRNRTVKTAKDSETFLERNLIGEVKYLVSAIRRLDISMAVFVSEENRQSKTGDRK